MRLRHVMSAKGILHHWREDERAERQAVLTREDITGLYDLGGTSVDITDLYAGSNDLVHP